MNHQDRLRLWTEQQHIVIPQYLFQHYKALGITDDEALILMHLCSFIGEGVEFPTPHDFTLRTHFSVNDISLRIQRLLQKGVLEITQGVNESGQLTENYSLTRLWERLVDHLCMEQSKSAQQAEVLLEKEIFKMFEAELGRLLSPIEIETISMWMDLDNHSPQIIKAALREAVLSEKVSIRYIDRILSTWKKKNITTVEQVEKHSESYRRHTMQGQVKASGQAVAQGEDSNQQTTKNTIFYNWLDERE